MVLNRQRKDEEAKQDYQGEVTTPQPVVNMMVKAIENHNADVFDRIEKQKEVKQRYNALSLNRNQTEGQDKLKYSIARGNNGALIKRVMETRPHWKELDKGLSLFQFRWAPVSDGINYDLISKHGQRCIVNHFENHKVLSEKDALYINMRKACEALHLDVFKFLPLTFVINYDSE